MKPAQSMYVGRGDWQAALITWMNENPTVDNNKEFIIFEGEVPSADNFMFRGDLLDFGDIYHTVENWDQVLRFIESNKYKIFVEDEDGWDSAIFIVEDSVIPEEEIWYDKYGNESQGGIYNAGGHINSERMSDWADNIRDRMKD